MIVSRLTALPVLTKKTCYTWDILKVWNNGIPSPLAYYDIASYYILGNIQTIGRGNPRLRPLCGFVKALPVFFFYTPSIKVRKNGPSPPSSLAIAYS